MRCAIIGTSRRHIACGGVATRSARQTRLRAPWHPAGGCAADSPQ
jgi:hypothetical protein